MTVAFSRLAPAIAALLLLLPAMAAGAGPAPRHAIAMYGEPKYGPGFAHFDYVNPTAPKGGAVRFGVQGTFDSFNGFIVKGNAAAGLDGLYESLMASSADEPFSKYGLIAESIETPEDRSWAIFTLRAEARWHDGVPITPEDVVWTLETLKTKGHPAYRFYYREIAKAEKVGPRRVKFTFAGGGNRELPLIAGEMQILPKHYWQDRDFTRTTLEPPLGSGPYRVAQFEPGRFVRYERVTDYWGADLAVNRGRYNFDAETYEYYRDATVIREAVKSGDLDLRSENQAKAWALSYDVPAVRQGWLKLTAFPHRRPTGMQAFVLNTRRAVFEDRRVRRALAFAFDFEWSNRNLFFDQYTRTESYFSNSDLAATGLPDGAELEVLNRFRDRLPPEVFTTPYTAPATDGSGWPRDNLRAAFDLLAEAGWVVRDLKLVKAETGEQMTFEFLLILPEFERIVLPFARNLRRLGIEPRIRLVDQAQYVNRVRAYDFDIVVGGWGQSDSPGNEQRGMWTTAAADIEGQSNYAGVRDPVVDALVDLVIAAPDREALVARTRALDRVLLWGHYVVPNWHLTRDRIVYWDKFGMPETVPKNGISFDYWWWDADKARRLETRAGVAEAD